ncbi:MAG: hypothetical protein ACRDQJ_08210 [Pseudonocardiaceae bacterium]
MQVSEIFTTGGGCGGCHGGCGGGGYDHHDYYRSDYHRDYGYRSYHRDYDRGYRHDRDRELLDISIL